MVVVDDFSNFLNVLLLVSGLAGIALAYDYLKRTNIQHSEYYILLLFSIGGMMLIGMSADLIMVFLALELLSIPLYVLAGIAVARLASEEAAIKYFLLGAFSSGFFVYGTALVYGATGTTALSDIVSIVQGGTYDATLLLLGQPWSLSAELQSSCRTFPHVDARRLPRRSVRRDRLYGVGAKAAGFAALLRIFVLSFPALSVDLTPVLWTLAALTMILGI